MADSAQDPNAYIVEFSSGVLPWELAAICERRRGATLPLQYEELAKPENETALAKAHRLRPFGIGLSGGGIRSATFNLGVLQGLAERGLLPYVDYLSTVSGGGYIGSWLHGVIRQCDGMPDKAQQLLSPLDYRIPGAADRDPISFLRKYSNYLAPRPGLFSPDTWVIGCIWLRNVLLNQLVLLPAIAGMVLAALGAGFLKQSAATHSWLGTLIATGAAELLLLGTVVAMSGHLRVTAAHSLNSERSTTGAGKAPSPGYAFPYLIFLSCLAILFCGVPCSGIGALGVGVGLPVLFFVFQASGGFWGCFRAQHLHLNGWLRRQIALLHLVWMPVLAAGLSCSLIRLIWNWAAGSKAPWTILTFAPPLVCLAIMAGVSLLIGLMGADYPDAAREWLASIGSDLAMICAAWMAFFGLSIFGPWLVSLALVTYAGAASAAIVTWAGTTISGALAGRSSSTNGANELGNPVLRILIAVAPSLFVVGYLILVSFGVQALVRNLDRWHTEHASHGRNAASSGSDVHVKLSSSSKESHLEVTNSPLPKLNWFQSHLQDMADRDTYFAALAVDGHSERWEILAGLLLLAGIVTVIASWRININEFSIHHFYKNRLVRCYMGASHGKKRNPDTRTGFDPKDDFPIASLDPLFAEKKYFGPYAIVNAALNLSAGSELATQERKATSFVFTPRFSGFETVYSKESERKKKDAIDFHQEGYRITAGFGSESGPDIGMAMAISGAAANPNEGYHTSGPMAFLLTVFNVRLGWWLGNPRFEKSSPRPGPLFSLKYLFMELAGQTTARTRFVNLSDGGHFDNLGLYELVRRRCRYIIIGDAEEDGQLTFEALGGAIRKCRADFGVEITINPDPIRLDESKFSSAHCVVGYIRYPELEQGLAADMADSGLRPPNKGEQANGWLLYVKSSLTGNEPADIAQYRAAHKEFPQQSTLQQFYTESQFESYRRLGLHAMREALADISIDMGRAHAGLLNLFQGLTRKWYAPVGASAGEGARLTDKYSELMKRLAETAELRANFGELLPGKWGATSEKGPLSPLCFEFGMEVIQLIEDIVNQYDFEQRENFSNPGIAGWVAVFGRWAAVDRFYKDVWLVAHEDYQHGFQTFMENLRNPKAGGAEFPSI